jgi:hypothetical protein
LDEEPDPKSGAPTGDPKDYVVIGMGYKTTLPGNRMGLTVRGSSSVVPMPFNAILGGVRGRPLHADPLDECLFAESATGKLKGTLTIRVSMAAGVLSWNLNGRSMPLKAAKGLEILKRQEPYVGTISLFTNGGVVDFDALTIEGELNPSWVEAKLRADAAVELQKFEPDYPFKK